MVPGAFADPAQALSGVGAARRGGRWNPRGVRAVYLGEDAELLAREVGYAQSLGGAFEASPKPPMALYSVEFELARVLRVDDAFVARIEAEWNAHLPKWLHHYNWHRLHSSLRHQAPISRLGVSVNKVVRLHI